MNKSIGESWESEPREYVAQLVATVERLNKEAADADRQLIDAQRRIDKALGICHRNLNMTICQQIAYALEGT